MSAAARQARLVAAMAQAMPCCGRRMVVVVNCCQNSLARMIDLRAYAWERLLCRPSWESALSQGVVQICQPSETARSERALFSE